MPAKLAGMSRLPLVALVLFAVAALHAQPDLARPQALDPQQAQAFVTQAFHAELRAAQDASHPMRYLLRKSSPRLSTTKQIYETRDGAVARLIAINGQPLDPAAEQKEKARLDALLADPGRQRHRKQGEVQDTARALKVLRALPNAFLYEYIGSANGYAGPLQRFTFRPNPAYDPPDLETQVLTAMTGEIWIDAVHHRVVRLQGSLRQDVNFGWGILGRLDRGGWIILEQADVGQGCWRIVRMQMNMSGRLFFKSRNFDTTQEESEFEPLPVDLTYAQAIQRMRGQTKTTPSAWTRPLQ